MLMYKTDKHVCEPTKIDCFRKFVFYFKVYKYFKVPYHILIKHVYVKHCAFDNVVNNREYSHLTVHVVTEG